MTEVVREIVKTWVTVVSWLTACGSDEMPHEWEDLLIEATRCFVRLFAVVVVTIVILLGARELAHLPSGLLDALLQIG